MAVTAERPAEAVAIRPFTIEVEADLDDLRARMAATRWPEETVDGPHKAHH